VNFGEKCRIIYSGSNPVRVANWHNAFINKKLA